MEISFTRVALLAAALFFVGCDQKPQPAKTHATEVTVLEGKTMGTFWRASIPGIDAKRSAELKEKIQTQLDADDQLLSTYKKDSALMRFNDSQSLSPWPVSEAMADIVTTSLRIGARTDGAMDITVGPLVNLWGLWPGTTAGSNSEPGTDRCDESQNRLTAPDGHQSVASAISAKRPAGFICRSLHRR
mgnify:FL=1